MELIPPEKQITVNLVVKSLLQPDWMECILNMCSVWPPNYFNKLMMAYLLVYLAKLDTPLRFLSVLLEADVLCKTGYNN